MFVVMISTYSITFTLSSYSWGAGYCWAVITIVCDTGCGIHYSHATCQYTIQCHIQLGLSDSVNMRASIICPGSFYLLISMCNMLKV